MQRPNEKVSGGRKVNELMSHFLRLLRLGSETQAFLSSREDTSRDVGYYGFRENVSVAALDTEYKKAQGAMGFQSRHRYL